MRWRPAEGSGGPPGGQRAWGRAPVPTPASSWKRPQSGLAIAETPDYPSQPDRPLRRQPGVRHHHPRSSYSAPLAVALAAEARGCGGWGQVRKSIGSWSWRSRALVCMALNGFAMARAVKTRHFLGLFSEWPGSGGGSVPACRRPAFLAQRPQPGTLFLTQTMPAVRACWSAWARGRRPSIWPRAGRWPGWGALE